MSLQNTVTTVFRADTAGYVAAVKHMRGAERAEAQKTLATLEQQNAKLTDKLSLITKAGAAVAGLAIVWKAASAAANAHLEDLRLEAAAAGANIDKLRDSTRGLVETDNLLAFAGKSMNGVWKLNQKEMETVAKGTDVLAKRMGIDLQAAMDAVTESVARGTTRSLKDLGIEVKDKEGALRAFADAARDAGRGGDTAGEKWQQATVLMADAWDDLKGAVGEFVIALAPAAKMIAEIVADISRLVASRLSLPGNLAEGGNAAAVIGGIGTAFGYGTGIAPGVTGGAWDQAVARASGQRQLLASGGGDVVANLSSLYARIKGAANETGSRALAEVAEEIEKMNKGSGRSGARRSYSGADPLAFGAGVGGGASQLGGAFGNVWAAAGNMRIANQNAEMSGAMTADAQAQLASLDLANQRIAEITARMDEVQGPTVLERIFGKPSDIDAMVVAIDVARHAVDTFGQAGAAAMQAWITGEQSMGDAIKAVLAKSLMALAMESTVKALFHLAAAAGSAAFGNFASAGMHLKTAGMYGAVAVAAGVGAKAAHSAGWAGGGSSGGGAGSALGGGGRGGYSGGGDEQRGERTIVVALGRDFGMLTDLEQRQMLNQAVRIGRAEGGDSNHVRFR